MFVKRFSSCAPIIPSLSVLPMPAPLNVNREAVKTLAIAIGVRKAAREMGIAQSTVQSWSEREKWFSDPPAVQKPPYLNGIATNATNAPDALANMLANDERETRANLATYARKCSETAASSPELDKAPLVHKVAQTAGLVHRWGDQTASVQFSLNVLNVGQLDVSVGE